VSTSVAERTGLRGRLAALVGATLRVSAARVGPFDSFASLGMDSLAAVELTAAIEDELGIELELTVVHEHPDLDSLARFIEQGDAGSARARQTERLRADAVLPPDLVPGRDAPVRTGDARRILLTGATGFLGAHLLRTLLDETEATISCLVRRGAGDALARVRCNLAKYGLWSDDDAARVRVVDGDLARPMLGRDARAFHGLAGEVDAIFHAGAAVNWVHAYESLRETNVIGTRELLRLACDGRPKPFHFISSTSVCHSTTGPTSADERTNAFASVGGLWLGYAQSKCVGEALVREAGARGLPATIVRPSLVTGDARGRSNVDDLTSRFIAGCVRMHAAPDLDWRMDCVPVDDAARAVVRLALGSHDDGVRVHHVTAPRSRHWRECVLWMRLRGHDVGLLPYTEWLEMLRAIEDTSHPLYALRSFFLRRIPAEHHLTLPELFEESRRPQVSSARSARELDTLGVTIGDVDSTLLSRYFDDFTRRGIVPGVVSATSEARARQDARPVLEPSETLAAGLREWLGGPPAGVERVVLSSLASDESIVAELTSWRAGGGTQAGLFNAVVSMSDGRSARLFLKAKSADTQSIEVAVALAGLASPALGEVVAQFRNDLGITLSHVRELAVYGLNDARLRAHTPRPILIERDDTRHRWLLALESIDDAVLMNANDPTRWDDASIDAALTGLASLHAAGLGDTTLAAHPWLPPLRDRAKYVAMTPLWTALAEHAHARSAAFQDSAVRRIHERLVGNVASWADTLDNAPRTLIHNDFNPRNVALRPGAKGLDLCAFDWELATIGAPQRDLAEFLVFVLPPSASRETVARWLERYRSLLGARANVALPRAAWEAGFSAALCDVLVDRLASYAMIDRVRPQRFLPRVVRSWLNVFTHTTGSRV
jgi:thioester reductase-like protein